MPDLIERLRNRASCGLHMGAEHGQTVFQLNEAASALEAMRDALRSIELRIDSLNTRAFLQKPETQAALDAVKNHTRAVLSKLDGKEAP